jgi:hypothetical protein
MREHHLVVVSPERLVLVPNRQACASNRVLHDLPVMRGEGLRTDIMLTPDGSNVAIVHIRLDERVCRSSVSRTRVHIQIDTPSIRSETFQGPRESLVKKSRANQFVTPCVAACSLASAEPAMSLVLTSFRGGS